METPILGIEERTQLFGAPFDAMSISEKWVHHQQALIPFDFLNSNNKTSGNLIRIKKERVLSLKHDLRMDTFTWKCPRNQLRFFPNMRVSNKIFIYIFHKCIVQFFSMFTVHILHWGSFFLNTNSLARQVLEPKASMVRRITPKLLGSSTSDKTLIEHLKKRRKKVQVA